MASSTRRDQLDSLRDALEPVVASQGADLEDLDITQAGRRTRIRVIVDADGGVDLDSIAAISHAVSQSLDDPAASGSMLDALSSGPYTLEVTSPGVDRPLTLPRHWRRNIGRLVDVSFTDGATATGRIRDAADDGATVDIDGVDRTITWASVERATIRIEFSRPEPKERG